MGNFRWLHISDLHFENITQYPIADIRDSFYKKLQQVCDEHPFDYVFITGDIADKNDYRASEENIKFLKDALKIDPNKIFWAPGNHDIVRKEKSYRSRLISDMRHGDLRFDEALQDDENRMLLLRPFQEYVKRNEQFLGYRPSSCLHNFYACEHLDIIVLNTSITSCDNQDNGNLFILNTDLIKCFNCHQSGRPLFVLGHHDISCFSIDEQKYLADKFDHSNVDLYLCGHQHRLNFDNLPGISRNLPQCVVGGGTDKNYCDFSFLVGDYDAEKNCFHIAPYVFNKNGNRTWNLDYNYLPRLTQDNQTSCCSFSKMGDVKITVPYLEKLQKEYSYLFPCTNYSAACPDNIKSKIQKFSLCVLKYIAQNINKNSLVSQDIVFLCSVAIKSDAFKNIDLNSICNLHLNEKCSWFEVYRGFYNTCQIIAILAEKEASMPPVPFEAFDFSKFYADVDQFNTDDTYYILVTDSLHDISADRLSVLANMPWNIIIDFDGTTDEGGLRQYLQRSSKSLYAQNNNLEEILFTKYFPVWLTFNDSFCRNSALSDITFNGLKLLYRKLATKLKESFSGDCTVIFLKQKDTSDNILISELFDRFGENCKFFFISSTYEDIKSELNAILFDSYGNNLNNYFAYSSNIYSFLTSLLEYRNSLLVQPIHSEKNSFPTIDGLKSLSENIYVNLSDCFELLTSDIGSDSSVHIENRDNFYKGHIATWDLFAQEDIVNVMHPEVYKNYLNLIKSSMATKLENPRGHIFTLLHAAGFGGTTLSRQIAWDLHLSHPVLLVHHYDPNQFVQRIRQLYDQHCRMGMLLIADENDLTASELENIEKDSLILDRPLALLIVKRDRDSGRTIRNKRVLRLNVLSYITIQSLKSRFSAASPLSKETLKMKYDNFPTVFGKNATPACPFFIGLYFMEKDFEGVMSYTKSIIQNLSSKDELETLAMLSFLDIYSGLGISNQMVRIWITVNTKSTYLGSYPYASEAFIAVSDAVYNISLIKGRNIILSEELFKQCIKKLYNCSPEEKLRQFAEKLIETVSKCCISGVSEYYQDLLEKIFITKYNGDSTATNESFLATDFSSLILAIPSPESKELVFNKLTSTFTTTVSNLSYEENISAYLMLSHFWGHFGRLYRSREMGSLVNYNKAIECCKKAEEIMLITERQDPYIYHMHGDSVSRKCFDWMSKNEANSDTKTEELDGLVEQAISYFERSMATGEIGRGALSSLDLLIAYLKYIYKCKELTSPNDYYKLDSTQLRYKGLVEDYIDLLEEIPKDYRGSQLFTRLKHEFYSEILFNNFGIAIQYYENRIAIVKNQQGEDSNELYQLRRSLANALIEKFKHKYSYDEPETIVKKDAKRITEILEQNIQRTVTYNDTYDQRQKAIDCYRWFRYAPYSDCSITEALTIVRKWMDLDSINGRSATPLPFYYEYVLLILRLQEGYEISKAEIQEAMQSSYRHAQNTSYSTTQIRNIFTQGHGLSQIKPFMGYPDLRKNFSSIKLMRIEGKFTKNYGLKRDGGLGCITITKPVSLRGLEVFFKMGKGNTVQENQTSHTLEFYVGFTCERMVAFDNLIADITSGETLDDKVSRWLNP